MNKYLILSSMVDSFKKANVSLAIEQGMGEKESKDYVESMSESIEKCMDKVLENLLENFSTFIK